MSETFSNADSDNSVVNHSAEAKTLETELTQAVESFSDLQTELNYQQAQQALRDLVNRLDLTPRERTGLEEQISSLNGLLDKLENTVVHIAVFGMVGRGKSSLLNALVGQPVFETGPTHGVTRQVESVAWQVSQEAIADAESQPILRVALQGLGNSRVELIDTPGIDEVNGAARAALAQRVAHQADLILFLVAGDITRVEFEALLQLRQASKPILLIFNKIDQYPEADRQLIYKKLRDERLRDLISPDEIVLTAAAPLIAIATRTAEGRLQPRLERGQPQVETLKLKILEILHREGKALVALNTLLYANEVNEQLVSRKLQIRDRVADDTIWNGVMTKAIAVALNPITVADLLSGAVIDVAMTLTLSRLYGIAMTQQGAFNLLQKVALGLGGIGVSELLVTFGLSSLKSILSASALATGGLSLAPYLPVAITQASVAGVSTYSIGQVIKAYLANGGSWGADGPKVLVNNILESLDEKSILNRIKAELRAKLETSDLP
ncbi:MAG: GTP-binding protein [Almyronema sp.]